MRTSPVNLPRLSFITKLTGICLVTLLTSQSAHAFNLNLNPNSTKQLISKSTFDSSTIKLSSLLIFEEKNMFDLINEIKDSYLTFYSNKNERVKATYVSGAYYLNYSSEW